MKYKEWLDEWLALYVKPSAKDRTYDKYLAQVKKQANKITKNVACFLKKVQKNCFYTNNSLKYVHRLV